MLLWLTLPCAAQTVSDFSFLTGRWQGEGFEEVWGAPRAGTMLGTSRGVEGDKTVHTEFMLLRDGGSLRLYLPDKDKTLDMTVDRWAPDEVEFVRPNERLTYRREGDLLRIKLEKPSGGFELTLRRVQ